jgi:hypothetical protein
MAGKTKFVLINGFGGVLAALVASISLAAEGPRYTYGEIGYVNFDFDDFSGIGADGDGFNVGGSVAIADMVHLFASYTDGDIDIDIDNFGFGEISVDYTELSAGIGINYSVSETVDLVGRLSYVDVEAEAFGYSEDENGYGLGAGVRAMVTPEFELNGGIAYADLGGDYDSDTALLLGAVYNFTEMFAATAGVSFADDVTQYGIGARVYLGAK